jgi:hypothetical protein
MYEIGGQNVTRETCGKDARQPYESCGSPGGLRIEVGNTLRPKRRPDHSNSWCVTGLTQIRWLYRDTPQFSGCQPFSRQSAYTVQSTRLSLSVTLSSVTIGCPRGWSEPFVFRYSVHVRLVRLGTGMISAYRLLRVIFCSMHRR